MSEHPNSPPIAHSFSALGLSEALCENVARAGYESPTPIQRAAIGHVLAGRDLLGSARTGTGKTAAFALPIIQNLMRSDRGRGRDVRCLVLAPTRELAAQIGASFETYGGRHGPRQRVVFGGVGKQAQVQALRRGVEVLVATPGRLMDLMNDGAVDLSFVETFVLDEADRMLDMGFIHDVRRIVRALPKRRQNLMFSATMPAEIQQLADTILKRPERVAVTPPRSSQGAIAQSVHYVAQPDKTAFLIELLRSDAIHRALVFARTKYGAERLAKKLSRAGFSASAIHGNKSQSARVRTLEGFRAGNIDLVVATDIAARGLDIKDVSHVINFDLPNEPESYVHRIGRTGRAGATGVAISFCSEQERPYLRRIEALTGNAVPQRSTPQARSEQRAARPRRHEGRSETTGHRAPQKRRRSRRVRAGGATGHRGRKLAETP